MIKQDIRPGASIFLGATTNGCPQPVFWDSHTPIINNFPPGALITGAPGSGKTNLGLTLAGINTILGKTTVILDPKGDFIGLKGIEDQIGKFRYLDLARGKPGILDPFYMASEFSDKVDLAIQVIDIFTGGLSGDELTALAPIIKDTARDRNPSLQKVVDMLRSSEKPEARNLGTHLDLLRELPFAKLCFAPGTSRREPIKINEGLTVFTLVGLQLPQSGTRPSEMKTKEKLASGIMFLLTDFLRRIMEDNTSGNPKPVIIDEAHAVVGNSAGAEVVRSMAKLGRSKYLSLILISQAMADLELLDIKNTISTRFAFRSDRDEATKIIESMNLPSDEGFEDIIVDMEVGECLMQDFQGRYSTMKVSQWKKDWADVFSSNPLDVLKRKNNQRRYSQQSQKGQ